MKEKKTLVRVHIPLRPTVETLLTALKAMPGVEVEWCEEAADPPEVLLLNGRVRWLGTPEGLDAGLVLEMVRRTLQSPPYLSDPVRTWVRSFPESRTIRVWIRKGCGYCVPTVLRSLDLVLEQPRFLLEIVDADEVPDRRPPEPLLSVPYLFVEETGRGAYGIPSHREIFGLLVHPVVYGGDPADGALQETPGD